MVDAANPTPDSVAANPTPDPVAAKVAFDAMSVDQKDTALFNTLAAVAVAVDDLTRRVGVLESAALDTDLEPVKTGLARLNKHIFGE